MNLNSIPNIDILKGYLLAKAKAKAKANAEHENKKLIPCGKKKSLDECFTLETLKVEGRVINAVMFWYNVEGDGGSTHNIAQEVTYVE